MENEKMSTKDFHIKKYENILLDFSQWEHKADCLYEVAELLKHHLEYELKKIDGKYSKSTIYEVLKEMYSI